MFWKSQSFKDLQDQWYKKAEESGFEDIEDGDLLKQRAANVYKQASRTERHAKCEYYLLLAEYIQTKAPDFDDGVDYFVMYYFSVGWNNAQIVRRLRELQKPRHRKTVMFIRRKYENRWGIRTWHPHQLKSRVMPR